MRQAHRQHAGAIAALASIFIVLPLLPANGAEANGASDAALVAAPPTAADKNGLREPSVGGPLVLIGRCDVADAFDEPVSVYDQLLASSSSLMPSRSIR